MIARPLISRTLIGAAMASLLAACATTPPELPRGPGPNVPTGPTLTRPTPTPEPPPSAPPPRPIAGFRSPTIISTAGLEWVIGKDARSLARTFGTPRLDVAEGDARKLQYSGAPCVLDIFLYPLQPGAEPVATHLEARRASDGVQVSMLDCANALRR